MSRKNYTHIQKLLPEIKAMISAGKSHREIEEFFGLTGDRPIHNQLKRERRKERKLQVGIMPRPKGRPRKDAPAKDIIAEQRYEINRLKMENTLLRDFLLLTERK